MVAILGIDPGLQHTGWGVITSKGSNLSYVACGTISTQATLPLYRRLHQLYEGISEVIRSYHPEVVAIEETFVNNNPLSSLKLGHARGSLMLAASLAEIPLHEYAARLVKKAITGVGKAEKIQVQAMVKCLLPTAQITSADAADALAVAICHSSHMTASQWEKV